MLSSVHTASLGVLLDRELPSDYRREATEHVAAEASAAVAQTESVVIFRLHAEWMALATPLFQGIAPRGGIHSLPHRRGGVLLGVTHVQGDLLICVSLAELLGVGGPATPGSRGDRLMMIKGDDGSLAFPVQEVYGVHRYRPEELRELPSTLAHARNHFTTGMLPWNGEWVARLDDALVLSALSRALS